jgi:hypothetical protein
VGIKEKAMRKTIALIGVMGFIIPALAGFKVKLVKPKKPEQFQVHTSAAGVTYAADLLLEGKDQDDYFYKELSPSNVISVRLAVVNGGNEEVVLPLEQMQLIGPDGNPVPAVPPEAVAQAVLQGLVVSAQVKEKRPVAVNPGVRTGDPRTDPADPRYDPSLDPNDPRYDPNDPRARRTGDPRYDRRGTYGGPMGTPGVDVVLNPGGGTGDVGDLSQFEKQLVEKDFRDKAHSTQMIQRSLSRDRFLYFSLQNPPSNRNGFTLRVPTSKGIPQEVILKF